MRKDYDLVGSYDNQRISTISAARTVNMFEYLDPKGKRPKVLLSTSGIVNVPLDFYTETGGCRASFIFNNAIYQVYGQTLLKTTGTLGSLTTTALNSPYASPPINPIAGTGYVGIDANTFQIIFVNGVDGWIYDTNTGIFAEITDTSFPATPVDACYLDGFFVVANGGTNNFQLSTFNQGLVWGADYTTNTGNAFVATSGGSPNLVLTTGTTLNYQIGTPIQFNGGGTLPTGTPAISVDTTYYIKSVVNSTTFTISTTNNGTAITFSSTGSGSIYVTNNGQLQLGSITSHPGTIVGCRTLHRRLFLFSQNYTEVWENAGKGTNLPFRRNNSLLMEVGTPALGSIAVGFDIMFFLAQDKDGLAGVMAVKGSQSQPVSNRALDYQLGQYSATTGISDARGILIKENGLIFYRLNFTSSNHTFVFNASMSEDGTPRWHEEEVLSGNRHPAQTHVYFDGMNFYGDYQSAVFYLINPNVATNYNSVTGIDDPIKRMRIGRQITPKGYVRLRIDRFQVDLLQGQTATGNLGFTNINNLSDIQTTPYNFNPALQPIALAQPAVHLSISKDGGQTYQSSLLSTMGKQGEFTHRTVWRKLGTTPRGQGFTPKIEFYAPIPFIILGASWDFEQLPE